MKLTLKAILITIALTGLCPIAEAADIAAGKAKSVTCAACHGATGISPNPAWPNLAGQKALYMEKQMQAFRDGLRKDPLMAPMAKGLSDADITNIAAYFASLKP